MLISGLKMFRVGRGPTFRPLPSGLSTPSSYKRFCSAATSHPERCILPCLQPPRVPPPPPPLPSPVLPPPLPTGRPWLLTSNSKLWSWHPGLLGELHGCICRQWSRRVEQRVLLRRTAQRARCCSPRRLRRRLTWP